jgi:aquaporin Z
MDTETKKAMRMYIGEFLATFIFLFSVCATTLNSPSNNIHVIGPIAAGFTAFCVVFCFGGHFNTAVTLGAIVGNKMDLRTGLFYILIQLAASFTAIGTIIFMFPSRANSKSLMVGPAVTGNASAIFSAVLMEFITTFILVLVIYRSVMGVQVKPKIQSVEAEDSKVTVMEESQNSAESSIEFQSRVKAAETRKNHAPLVIGLAIGFLSTMGGEISGGAFNPLRATPPAVFLLDFHYVWIYWLGDCLGGVAAGLFHYYVFEDHN